MRTNLKQERQHDRVGDTEHPNADNDDDLPVEICRIVDALARAAARRDHDASRLEKSNRD